MYGKQSDSSMEHVNSIELLNLLKTRYETRRREIPAIDENEGQQLITDFFQQKSKDGQDKSPHEKDASDENRKTMTWQSPKKRARSPSRDSSCKTIPPVPLFSVESPVKSKRTYRRIRLKLKTPVKSPGKITALDQCCQDKENCNPNKNEPVITEKDSVLGEMMTMRKDSVVGEMMAIVQKVKREARQAKESIAQEMRFECEQQRKRRCLSLESSGLCKAPQKGLRV